MAVSAGETRQGEARGKVRNGLSKRIFEQRFVRSITSSEFFQRTNDLVVVVRFRFGRGRVRVAAIVLGGESKLVLAAFTEDAEMLRFVFVDPWHQVRVRGFTRVLFGRRFVIVIISRIHGVYRANHGGKVPDVQRVPEESEPLVPRVATAFFFIRRKRRD